jgi:hypothetical protein
MNEPAYLVNLKAYGRQMIGDNDNVKEIIADLNTESDRSAFILAATSIEDTIEWALLERMPVLAHDNQSRKRIFGAQGSLSTYADKILLAYALGMIDREGQGQIDLVREIRNTCAHSRRPLSMEIPVLVEAVKAAIGPEMLSIIKDHQPRTLRVTFIAHCSALAVYVATGKRRSLLEVHVYAENILAELRARP